MIIYLLLSHHLKLWFFRASSFSFPQEKICVSSMKYNLTLTLPHSFPHCLHHFPFDVNANDSSSSTDTVSAVHDGWEKSVFME